MGTREPCEGRKIKHPSFKLAMRAMLKVKTNKGDLNRANQDCAVYFCPDCQAYHWGHVPRGYVFSPKGITESLRHCDTVSQVNCILSFYDTTIRAMLHSTNVKHRKRGERIMQLAAIKREVLK